MEAKPPIRFRKLRIAWSAGCAIACVLLVVLWVRSYNYLDILQKSIGWHICELHSVGGNLSFDHRTVPQLSISTGRPLSVIDRETILSEMLNYKAWIRDPIGDSGFPSFERKLTLRYWFLVLLAAAFFAAPWLPWRFSLRTLLIAITLVAAILGIIAASN